jgi:putative SOS response-associated peptidase YedK
MPVILKPDAEAAWLDPKEGNPDKLMPLVGPYLADLMALDDANPALNKPSFEGPDCLLPPTMA